MRRQRLQRLRSPRQGQQNAIRRKGRQPADRLHGEIGTLTITMPASATTYPPRPGTWVITHLVAGQRARAPPCAVNILKQTPHPPHRRPPPRRRRRRQTLPPGRLQSTNQLKQATAGSTDARRRTVRHPTHRLTPPHRRPDTVVRPHQPTPNRRAVSLPCLTTTQPTNNPLTLSTNLPTHPTNTPSQRQQQQQQQSGTDTRARAHARRAPAHARPSPPARRPPARHPRGRQAQTVSQVRQTDQTPSARRARPTASLLLAAPANKPNS